MVHSFFSGLPRIESIGITQVEGVELLHLLLFTHKWVYFNQDRRVLQMLFMVKGVKDLEQEDKVTGLSQYVTGSVDFQTSPLIEETATKGR